MERHSGLVIGFRIIWECRCVCVAVFDDGLLVVDGGLCVQFRESLSEKPPLERNFTSHKTKCTALYGMTIRGVTICKFNLTVIVTRNMTVFLYYRANLERFLLNIFKKHSPIKTEIVKTNK